MRGSFYRITTCDHGHVIFEDGSEVEFGFTPPQPEELAGTTLYQYVEKIAREWAGEPDKKIVSLRLAGG